MRVRRVRRARWVRTECLLGSPSAGAGQCIALVFVRERAELHLLQHNYLFQSEFSAL
jgi:hypothetical protein